MSHPETKVLVGGKKCCYSSSTCFGRKAGKVTESGKVNMASGDFWVTAKAGGTLALDYVKEGDELQKTFEFDSDEHQQQQQEHHH